MSFFSRKKHQNQPSNNVNIVQSPSQALQQAGATLQQPPQVTKQPSYEKSVFLSIPSRSSNSPDTCFFCNYRGFPNGSPSTSSSATNNSMTTQRMGPIQPPQPQQQPRGVSPVTAAAQQQQQQQSRQPTYPWSQRKLNLNPPVTIQRPGVAPPQASSPSPFPRYGHALPSTATASGELFLFGGLVREQVRNDVYLISTRELSATMLQTTGEIPSPRVGHASALVGSVLIVWGGDTKTSSTQLNPSDSHDDGLYLLNLCKFR